MITGACIPHEYYTKKYTCSCLSGFSGKNCENELSKYTIIGCDFEEYCEDFKFQSNSSYKWIIIRGPTRSQGTGPTRAHGGYRYAYTEASDPAVPKNEASISSVLTTVEEEACLTFYYHMLGEGIGELKVRLENKENIKIGEELVIVGQQGDMWQKGSMEVPSGQLRIVITAIRGKKWSGDISVDDIQLKNGRCNAKEIN